MRSLLFIISLSTVLPAFAWRETNNGGGITEQNIVYITQNFSKLTSVLVQDPISTLTTKEQIELARIVQLFKDQIVIRFENQEHKGKSAFEINESELWIFTKYLGSYDLNKNEELSWAEVISLILDAYFNANLSQFNNSEFKILKSKTMIHFNKRIYQQLIMIKTDNFLQSTSIADSMGHQEHFLIQANYSNVISLTRFAEANLGCSQNLEIKRLSNLRIKYNQVDENNLIFLSAVDIKFVCAGQAKQNSMLLKFSLKEKALSLIDFAIQ